MRKIKTKLELIKTNAGYWDLTIHNRRIVVEECVEQWVISDNVISVDLEATITSPFQLKTSSQLGYFYAAVLPVFFKYMNNAGDDSSDDNKKNMLKLHPAINFCEIKENPLTGELIEMPRSYSKASKEEMSDIIDRHIRLAADFGLDVETSENYKKRKGIKEFIK